MVMHTFNANTCETEADLLSSRQAGPQSEFQDAQHYPVPKVQK